MRLVLDTNIVASGMLWGGSPKLLLQAGRKKRVELFTSTSFQRYGYVRITEGVMLLLIRHSSASWNPGFLLCFWMPAFAGMTGTLL